MKYLPITLIATLSASLAVALFFTPTLGALLGRAAPCRMTSAPRERGLYMRTVQARAAPSRRDAGARASLLLVARAGRLWQVRPRRRVLPRGRARLRPGHRARARQPLARREGPPRARRSRSACSAIDGLKTVYTRVGEQPRGSSEITEDTIGVIQFEFADWQTRAAGARDHGRHPRQDRGHSRHPGRGDGAARRPADRQADPGAALRARSGRAAGGREEGRRRCSRTMPDIRDLDDGLPLPGIDWKLEVDKAEAAKYGASVDTVGTARAARHQRRQGHRIPPGRHRQGGRHHGALPAGPAQPRPDRRTARADAGRLGADRQFRQARAGAARRLHQPRRRQARR